MKRHRFLPITLFFALLLQIAAIPIDPFAGKANAAVGSGIVDITPFSGSDIASGRPITLKFDEEVRRGTGSVQIRTSGTTSAVKSYNIATDESNVQWIANNTISINTDNLSAGSYYLYIPETAILGLSGEAFPGLLAEGEYDFDIVAPLASPTFDPPTNGPLLNLDVPPLALKLTFPYDVELGSTGSILIKKDSNDAVAQSIITPAQFASRVQIIGGDVTIALNADSTDPLPSLNYNTKYYVTITPGTFVDLSGNPYNGISNKNTWSFTTREKFDNIPPTIDKYDPANAGNWNMDKSNQSLVLTFNEKVFAGTGFINIKRNQNGGVLICSIPADSSGVTFDSTGKVVTIRPTSGNLCPTVSNNAPIRVEIDNQAFRDANGNYFAGNSNWTFTAKTDTTPPAVSSYSPTPGSTNVAVGISTFSITFNEPVAAVGTASVIPFGTSSSIANLTNPKVNGNTVTYTLTGSALKASTKYTIRIPNTTASNIKDLSGNAFPGISDASVWTFTTASAGNIPVLNKAEMDGNAILLTYSETLDSTKVPAASNFSVTVNNVSNPVTSVTVSGTQVRLTLQNNVLIGQVVKVSYTLNSTRSNRIQSIGLREAAAFSAKDVTNTAETTLPKPSSGVAAGTTIVLTFNKTIAALGTDAYKQFSVIWGSQVVNPTSISGGGSTSISLVLPSVTATTSPIYVAYTPGTAPLKDLAGNTMLAFSGFQVVNTGDTTAPTFTGATAVGSKVILVYSEQLKSTPLPALSSFSITVGGVATAVSAVAIQGNNVELTLSTAIATSKQVTISYVPPVSNPLMDLNNNLAANINAHQITGNPPVPTKLSTATVKDTSLVMTYNADLSNAAIPTATQYTVKVDGAAVAVTAVSVSGKTVTLTLPTAVKYRQTVTVSYVTTGTALKDTIGQTVEASTDAAVTNQASFLGGQSSFLEVDSAGGLRMIPASIDKQSATTPSGRTANKYMVAADKLNAAFSTLKLGMGSDIKIPQLTLQIPTSESGALVSLPVNALISSAASVSNGVIKVEYGDTSWNLPLSGANWTQAAQATGNDPASAQLVLKIEKVANNGLTSTVMVQGGEVIGSPVDFTAVMASNGTEKEIPGYDVYIQRSISVSASGRSAGDLSVVRLDPNSGDVVYVPTKIESSGGSLKANFLRKGNSVYALIEKPANLMKDMETHWAGEDVALLASKYIVTGSATGNFNPNMNITRADFAEFIARGLGLSGDKSAASKFSDVNTSTRAASYIGAASKAGIVSGDANGKFRPGANITREEMASMMIRAMRYAGVEPNILEEVLDPFTDKAKIGGWAKEAVIGCVDAGLIAGVSPTTIKPKDNATRAQAASMIKRLLEYVSFL